LPRPIPPAWAEAIDKYVKAHRARGDAETTLYTRRQHLEHMARRVELGPWEIDGDALVDYAGAQPWARETRRGRRATFDSFYRWAKRTGRIKRNPVKTMERVRAGEPSPNPVPDAVYLAALFRADADEALWIDLAADHGLRRAEIARIHSDDLIPTLLGYDLLVHGKGNKIRRVPLTSAMHRALADRGAGWVFPGEIDGHVSPRWVGVRVGRLLDGTWTIHKLRHRAATRFWVVSGGDSYAVAELMGWANVNMVRTYVQLPATRLREIVEGAARAGSALRV